MSIQSVFRNNALLGAGTVGVMALFATDAGAVSAGCAAANLTSNNSSIMVGPLAFEAGDVINYSPVAGTSGSLPAPTLAVSPAVVPDLTQPGSITIPTSDTYTLTVTNPVFFDVTLTCVGGVSSVEAAAETASTVTSRTAINQAAGLIAGRVSSFTSGGRSPSARSGGATGGGATGGGAPQTSVVPVDQGFLGLSSDRLGASAGDGLEGIGVWANASWNGVQDKSAVAAQTGNVFTGIAGVDKAYDTGLLLGVAVSIGNAAFESDLVDYKSAETSVGINVYGAYSITDTVSVDGFIGYSRGWGRSDRSGDTVEGDWTLNRYFLAGNVSFFQSWDAVSLGASTGFVWGQSFEGAYEETDGTRVGSRRSQLGSWKALVQPSYLVTVDEDAGLYFEPYAIGEASYDLAITKITGHNNDRDSYRVGTGFNLFLGDNISTNLEASTTLGREDYNDISVVATFRYSF